MGAKLKPGELATADDEALAEAAREGDHLAFGEIYRRYHPVLASYVRQRIQVGGDDVVQTVFFRLHKGLKTYRGPRLFPWAYRLCVNVVTDELRQKQRMAKRSFEGVSETTASESVPTPEDELIARRLHGRLSGVLDKLPEKQRAVFLLARVEGLDYAEISDLLNVPVGTVKSRMWKAVKTLVPQPEGAS